MEELVRANPGLTTVDFAENKLFQDDAVEAVLTHCKYGEKREEKDLLMHQKSALCT